MKNINVKINGKEYSKLTCTIDQFVSEAKKAGAKDINVFKSRRNDSTIIQFTLIGQSITAVAE